MAKALWTNGTSFSITKVGYDTNGNWSYWLLETGRPRSVKIQHMAMGVSNRKLTKSLLARPSQEVLSTIQAVIDYYRKYKQK
jgi:hypothetical protein